MPPVPALRSASGDSVCHRLSCIARAAEQHQVKLADGHGKLGRLKGKRTCARVQLRVRGTASATTASSARSDGGTREDVMCATPAMPCRAAFLKCSVENEDETPPC
eukprot:1100810-Pleurochrysis_carterae.AAC.2